MSERPQSLIPPRSPRRPSETITTIDDTEIENESLASGTPHLKHLVEDVNISDDAVQFFVGGRNDEMVTRRMELGKGSWNVQVNNMESGEDVNKLAEVVERDRKRATAASSTFHVSPSRESTPSSFAGPGCTLGARRRS